MRVQVQLVPCSPLLHCAAPLPVESSTEAYSRMRSWTELLQDELNLTVRSVQRYGIVDTVRQEFRGALRYA